MNSKNDLLDPAVSFTGTLNEPTFTGTLNYKKMYVNCNTCPYRNKFNCDLSNKYLDHVEELYKLRPSIANTYLIIPPEWCEIRTKDIIVKLIVNG